MDSQKISTGSSESDCTTVPALSVVASVADQKTELVSTPMYQAALKALRADWSPYSELRDIKLPLIGGGFYDFPYAVYESLVYFGLAEVRQEAVTDLGGRPRGCRFFFRRTS